MYSFCTYESFMQERACNYSHLIDDEIAAWRGEIVCPASCDRLKLSSLCRPQEGWVLQKKISAQTVKHWASIFRNILEKFGAIWASSIQFHDSPAVTHHFAAHLLTFRWNSLSLSLSDIQAACPGKDLKDILHYGQIRTPTCTVKGTVQSTVERCRFRLGCPLTSPAWGPRCPSCSSFPHTYARLISDSKPSHQLQPAACVGAQWPRTMGVSSGTSRPPVCSVLLRMCQHSFLDIFFNVFTVAKDT